MPGKGPRLGLGWLLAVVPLAFACSGSDSNDAGGGASGTGNASSGGTAGGGGNAGNAGAGGSGNSGAVGATGGSGGLAGAGGGECTFNDFSAVDNFAKYNAYLNKTQAEINASASGPYKGVHNPDFTDVVSKPDNGAGPGGQGQFRIGCVYSHFGYEDPIIKPNAPCKSHLHMFWGNTKASAHSVFNNPSLPADPNDIMESGGGTCQGGALNRSLYWIPAMYDGPLGKRNLAIPHTITLYYKSHRPWEVQPLPAGIQLLIGNVNAGGTVNKSFTPSDSLHWGCYEPSAGQTVTKSPTIPGTGGTAACPSGQDIQATIQFPQCLATDDGKATGNPVLTHQDFLSHTKRVNNNDPCPASHPYRVPQISYLIRWKNPGASISTWRLSCDEGFESASPPTPGGCLHGDWLGGWNEFAIQTWIDGCFDPDTNPAGGMFTNKGVNNFGGPRNCSIGQLGHNKHYLDNGKAISFDRVSKLNDYTGPQLVPDPCPGCSPLH